MKDGFLKLSLYGFLLVVVSEFHEKIIALQNRLKIDLENLE